MKRCIRYRSYVFMVVTLVWLVLTLSLTGCTQTDRRTPQEYINETELYQLLGRSQDEIYSLLQLSNDKVEALDDGYIQLPFTKGINHFIVNRYETWRVDFFFSTIPGKEGRYLTRYRLIWTSPEGAAGNTWLTSTELAQDIESELFRSCEEPLAVSGFEPFFSKNTEDISNALKEKGASFSELFQFHSYRHLTCLLSLFRDQNSCNIAQEYVYDGKEALYPGKLPDRLLSPSFKYLLDNPVVILFGAIACIGLILCVDAVISLWRTNELAYPVQIDSKEEITDSIAGLRSFIQDKATDELPSQANKTVPVVFSLVNQSGRLVLLQADSEQEAIIEASLAQSKRRQRNHSWKDISEEQGELFRISYRGHKLISCKKVAKPSISRREDD